MFVKILAVVAMASAMLAQQTPQNSVLPAGTSDTAAAQPATPAASAPAASAPAPSAPVAAVPAPSRPVRRVPVLLSVTDAAGEPVTGLSKGQLTIIDNTQLVSPLDIYSSNDLPLHLGVILLAGHPTFAQQQTAAADLVQKLVRRGKDEAFIVAAHGKKAWPGERLEWKSEPEELTKSIQAMDKNAGLPDAFMFDITTDEVGFDLNAGRNSVQHYAGGGPTVFDASFQMMNSDPRPARRVIVIFREPWAHSPGYGQRVNGSVEGTLARIIAAAQAMHISVFVFGVEDLMYSGAVDQNIGKVYQSLHAGEDGGGGTANREYDREMAREKERSYTAGKTNIERLAAETGGSIYWSAKKNYPDGVNAIANQIKGQYIVTFTPSDTAGPVHSLKISAANAGRVIAQSAFYFGQAPK